MSAAPRAVVITAEQTVEVLRLAQEAQDADSNDLEIDTLRGALEYALDLLGLGLPEGQS